MPIWNYVLIYLLFVNFLTECILNICEIKAPQLFESALDSNQMCKLLRLCGENLPELRDL